MSEPTGASAHLGGGPGGDPGPGPPVILASAAFAIENLQALRSASLPIVTTGTRCTVAFWWRPAYATPDRDALISWVWSSSSTNSGYIRWDTDGSLIWWERTSSGVELSFRTERILRDPTAWYHIYINGDTVAQTFEFRVNGEQVAYTTESPPSASYNFRLCSDNVWCDLAREAQRPSESTWYTNGLYADVSVIRGAIEPISSFGQFDSVGRFVPVENAITYPAHSFRWAMGNALNLAEDTSGNGLDGTAVNGPTQRPDSPDDTYPLINTVDTPADRPVVQRAGTRCTSNGAPTQSRSYHGRGTHGVNPRAGVSFYAEATVTLSNGAGQNFNAFGVYVARPTAPAAQANLANADNIIVQEDGTIRRYGTNIGTIHAAWGTVGDVVGVAVWDQGVSFNVNGNWQGGEPGVGTPHVAIADVRDEPHVVDAVVYRSVSVYAGQDVNFGQSPFVHAPAGFTGWSSRNLPTPEIADPRDYVETRERAGTEATADIALQMGGTGLSIVKGLSDARHNSIVDSVRGELGATDKFGVVQTNSASAELTYANGDYRVHSPGRQVVGTQNDFNANGESYSDIHLLNDVACGVAIITYTGNGVAGRAVPHGLGVPPAMVWVKHRSSGLNWKVGHSGLGTPNLANSWQYEIRLNQNNARNLAPSTWNNTPPDDTNVYLGTSNTVNDPGDEYVMYAFAPVDGFSAFGVYDGNNSADGPFISLDFTPEWYVTKSVTATLNWIVQNRARSPINPMLRYLLFDSTQAETTVSGGVDRLAAGLKFRTNSSGFNGASSFVWGAFARYPFLNIAPRAV